MAKLTTNPFITVDGSDIYEQSNWVYYLYNVFIWLHFLLFFFWGVFLLLITVPYTYFWRLEQPGTLLSFRYRSLLSIMLILSVLRFLVPIFARALLRFKRSYECSIVWTLLLGIILFVDILVTFWLLGQYFGANVAGDFYNVCNANEYCCAFWQTRECYRNGPCTNPAFAPSDLGRNGLCTAMVTISIPMMILSALLFVWPVMMWMFPMEWAKTQRAVERGPYTSSSIKKSWQF